MNEQKDVAVEPRPAGAGDNTPADVRKPKFGAASEGWEAYNTWLDRVRQQGGAPTSRQAVISKALYSLSSYKNWADKARGAFDEGK
jgi:hypothetical protein